MIINYFFSIQYSAEKVKILIRYGAQHFSEKKLLAYACYLT